jgi:hypothetical protein
MKCAIHMSRPAQPALLLIDLQEKAEAVEIGPSPMMTSTFNQYQLVSQEVLSRHQLQLECLSYSPE